MYGNGSLEIRKDIKLRNKRNLLYSRTKSEKTIGFLPELNVANCNKRKVYGYLYWCYGTTWVNEEN